MNFEEITNRLAHSYATCRSYSDEGYVEFLNFLGKEEKIFFRTMYVRPGLIRFDWQDYGPARGKSIEFSSIIGKNNESIVRYTWDPKHEETKLTKALAEATGCSAGAASVVLPLLMESQISKRHIVLGLEELKLSGEGNLDGERCYLVEGKWFNGDQITIWIRAVDYIVRRVRRLDAVDPDFWIYDFSNAKFDPRIASETFAPTELL